MALYKIQDDDRPAFVLAETFEGALAAYALACKDENDGDAGDLPKGITHIADDTDIVINGKWLA